MIPVNAGTALYSYARAMTRYLLRLLALIAVVLMPMGMAAAPVAAQVAPNTQSGHCEDSQKPADEPAKSQPHCTACSAVPAIGGPESLAGPLPKTARVLARIGVISGVEPELATPPPKRF